MGWSDRTKMNLRNNIAAVTCLGVIALGMSVPQAQSGERFRGRLSRLPVDRPTAPLLTGSGEVTATLDGNELTITATFEGMSSPATVAHMHRARMGLRGPVAFTVDVPATAKGEVEDTVTLTDAQLRDLRDGLYYLQIHTEGNAGGELRGWLLPQ